MFIEWDKEYSLDIPVIDEQHKQFVNKLNELYYALKEKDFEKINKILKSFQDYSVYHFDYEDKLMSKYSYPSVIYHLEKHQEYIDKIDDLIKKKDECFLGHLKLFNFLRDWFVNHICYEDKKYVEHLFSINTFDPNEP